VPHCRVFVLRGGGAAFFLCVSITGFELLKALRLLKSPATGIQYVSAASGWRAAPPGPSATARGGHPL
jgi:hypothetical protein